MSNPKKRVGRSVTVTDVAREAGVSVATVSRAVNNSDLVTAETKRVVDDAIRRTGYVLNAQGRALRLGRTDSVGVLVTEPVDELFVDPTYGVLLRGIAERLSANSVLPVIFQASSPAEWDLAISSLGRRTVDAVIHLTPYRGPEILARLAEIGLPVVLCGQLKTDPHRDVFSTVYADDVLGARLAATHLVQQNHRRIGAVLGPPDNPATIDRLQGYREVLGRRLPTTRIAFTGWDSASGFTAAQQLLQTHPRLDAVIAGSDRIALGVIAAAAAAGRSVPQDLAVIGFDDHTMAASSQPPLTTIAQPLREEGEIAADLALKMIAGGAPETVILGMTLVQRESA